MLQNPKEFRTPIPPTPPMPWPTADHPPPAEMTVAELRAAVAVLPDMRDALREAFDRLAACSPTPLPFAWVDLDAHVSSLQSSILVRFRQVQSLEAARAVPAATAAPGGSRGDRTRENLEEEEEEEEDVFEVEEVMEEQEVEEVAEVEEELLVEEEEEVVKEQEVEEVLEVEEEEKVVEVEEFLQEEEGDEEMQQADNEEAEDKIGKDGRYEEAREVLQEEEVDQLADDRIGNDIKDDKEQEARRDEQYADEEMQVANEEMQSTEDAGKSSQDKEQDANMEEGKTTKGTKKSPQVKEGDANMEDEQHTDMEEALTKNASAMQCNDEEACGVKQEEEEEDLEAHQEEEGAKSGMLEEMTVANEMSLDLGRSLPVGFNDKTASCANMDAQRLVKLLFTNTGLNSELHAALHRAPDAAALALHMVELFLHDKMLKTNKAWVNCVGLIRMVPVVVTELSADTIEQAKPVAKDWKEMIDNSENCTVLGSLASWGFLYFLTSYNIVSEFETKEIFRLFGTMPRKQQKMNYAMLFKGLRLTDRIPELMDYLIENGQQMDVLYWTRIFNLVDKYPPVSLLKGYIEKAKQTAIEISQKNMTSQSLSVVVKELDNLKRAQDLVDQQITDSSLSTTIKEEISNLLGEFGKRKQSLAKRSLAKSNTTSTSKSQQQHTEGNKKHKEEEERHKGQESQKQQQQSKPEQKLEKKLDKPNQKQQQKQEYKPHEKQQQSKKQKQSKKQHAKWPRQHTPKLPARASPAAQNAPLRGHFGHPPYFAINGVSHGYPAQPGLYCVPPFVQLGAPENIGAFNPFYPHLEFYP